jgi:hypothetical protein
MEGRARRAPSCKRSFDLILRKGERVVGELCVRVCESSEIEKRGESRDSVAV